MGFLDEVFCAVFNITWSFLEALGFGRRSCLLFFLFFFRVPSYSSIVSVGILVFFHSLSLGLLSLFLM